MVTLCFISAKLMRRDEILAENVSTTHWSSLQTSTTANSRDTPHWPVRTGTFSCDVTSIANCALTVRKPWSKDPMKWLQIKSRVWVSEWWRGKLAPE
jgi:hypothetical protein